MNDFTSPACGVWKTCPPRCSFGRMFHRLPVFEPEPDFLRTLADSIRKSGPPVARSPRHSVSSSCKHPYAGTL